MEMWFKQREPISYGRSIVKRQFGGLKYSPPKNYLTRTLQRIPELLVKSSSAAPELGWEARHGVGGTTLLAKGERCSQCFCVLGAPYLRTSVYLYWPSLLLRRFLHPTFSSQQEGRETQIWLDQAGKLISPWV